MQETRTPQVNEVNEFLEIASDFENPLEVIRESLSNSYDARASEVLIEINQRPRGSEIIIEDDGEGMNSADLSSFFDLGNSTKRGNGEDSIGYKGHGTKIFYKSDRIEVNTASDGTNLRATMERPWQKLNNGILPEYEVNKTETRPGTSGTRIRITGFKSGRGFEPSSLTYNKIEHYLKWKTLAGSTAHFFDDEFYELEITIRLGGKIDDTRDEIVTNNKLEFPDEQLEPGDGEFPEARMCKHYEPRELEITTDDGQSTTLQVVGIVGGKEARDELPTYGRHSAQFGIWLAKDHITVERLNEAISHDNEFIHFLFVANSQDIELSANREKIRNKSSPIYQAIEEKLDYYLSKITSDPWFKTYLEQRRTAELNRKARSQEKSIEERQAEIEARDRFQPTNKAEVMIALERSNRNGASPIISVEDFNPGTDVNALVEQNDSLYGASVHEQLTDHFDADKPLGSISKIVCWTFGDRDELRQIERTGYHDGRISFDFENNRIEFRNGRKHTIHIVDVESRFDRIESETLALD